MRTPHRRPTLFHPFALAALLCCSGPLAAQTAVTLPPGAEPGREPLRPVLPTPGLAAPPVAVPQAPSTEAPAGAQALRFRLADYVIEGATAFHAAELQPLYAPLLGTEISVADAFGVAQAIERRYREAGYVTSRVIVPQQTVEGGRFRVVVVEGFIADISYQGDIGPARAAVERLLAPLRDARPVDVADVERRLLLANDLAGLTVRAALEPSPTVQGGSVLVVRSERQAVEPWLSLDNRLSPYLGRAQLAGGLAWNSFGSGADRLSFSAKASLPVKRSHSVGLNYDRLLTDQGSTLGLGVMQGRSRPGRELEALDVRSRVEGATVTLTHPFIRSREQNLRGVAQFEVRDVDTDIGGTPFTADRLRIGRVGLSFDRSDGWNGVTALRGTVHKGFGRFGASAPGAALASRPDGRAAFIKLTLDATRVQQVTERISLLASATAQVADDPLLASEEMGLGGGSFGRGYDDGEISADSGTAASLELRYALPTGLQFYGFIDGGRLRAHADKPALARRTLSSAGFGMRASVAGVFATLELAQPTGGDVRTQGDKRPRLFASVSSSF